MVNLLTFFIATCISLSSTSLISEDELFRQKIGNKHEQTANFIVQNVTLFADMYNSELDEADEHFNATSVEYRTLVYNVIENKYNTYIDFNGNNGYVLVSDNYMLYSFETKGDLPYLREYRGNIFYDTSGFCYYRNPFGYYNFEKNYQLLQLSDSQLRKYNNISKEVCGSALAPKVTQQITDDNFDSYISDRYSAFNFIKSGYKIDKSINEYCLFDTMFDTSVFRHGWGTEGNCGLHAAYTALDYWFDYQYKFDLVDFESSYYNNILNQLNNGNMAQSVNHETVLFNLFEDISYENAYTTAANVATTTGYNNINSIAGVVSYDNSLSEYQKYQNGNNYNENYFTVKLPTIYYKIRLELAKQGLHNHKYVYSGAYIDDLANGISNVLNYSNYSNSTVNYKLDNFSMAYFANEINNNRPIILLLQKDDVYSNHYVYVNGYRVLRSMQKLNSFYIVPQTLFCVRISNGWDSGSYWLDMPNMSALFTRENKYAIRNVTSDYSRYESICAINIDVA